MKVLNRPIMIVAGEGGHSEQMNRLCALLRDAKQKTICVGEGEKSYIDIKSPLSNVLSRTSKSTSKMRLFILLPMLLGTLFWALYILMRYRPKGVILLGPLFCVPFLIACKLIKVKVVFIESWSRFSSPTQTGKLSRLLNAKIFYQNIGMESFYPEGKYSGKL